MRYYGLTYLISPHCNEEEMKKIQEKLNSLVQEEGGILGNSEIGGRKKLDYKIGGEEEAILVNSDFYLNPGKIGNLEKKIKSERRVLRYLLFTKKEKKETKVPKPRRIKKEKVELAEIEEKLKEILNESR